MSITKPVFEWSINLGHVLTFLGFIITGTLAFSNLDKRVAVVETAQVYQVRRDAEQDRVTLEAKSDLRDALRDVNSSLTRLNDKLDAQKSGK